MTTLGFLLLFLLAALPSIHTESRGPCECCGGTPTSPDCPCTNLPLDLHVTFDGWDCICLAGPTTRAVAISRSSATPGLCFTSGASGDIGDGCDNNSYPRTDDCLATDCLPFSLLLCCITDDFGHKYFELSILWCAAFWGPGINCQFCTVIAKARLDEPITSPSTCSPVHLVFTGFTWDAPFALCTSGGAFIEPDICTDGVLPTSATVTL